jgi:hypothetical protein
MMLINGARAQDSAKFFNNINNIPEWIGEAGDRDKAIINETIVAEQPCY